MPSVSRRRVVITGAGAISAAGIGADPLWQAAHSGISAIEPIELAPNFNRKVALGGQIKQLNAEQHNIAKNTAAYCDRFSLFAIIAADEAIKQADLISADPLGPSTGVVLGTAIGGINTIENATRALINESRVDPLSIPKAMPCSAVSHLSIRYGCQGPSFAISSACASATQAIGIGTKMIQSGVLDRVIVGGSDSIIAPAAFRCWELLRVLSPDLCRPFSKDRNGMVLGEGAAIFVLESDNLAHKRNAPALAEILGYGTTTDAVDMLRPDIRGVTLAMKNAIEDAGISPNDIDYINAHGTGTNQNDSVEAQAIRQVFGERTSHLPVSSTKPIHGHALGAAGALELLITVKALTENIAPPTINWVESDANCPIDPVPNKSRSINIRTAMSNSFAFGGINAVLIVRKPGLA
jgi:nodulation protein E